MDAGSGSAEQGEASFRAPYAEADEAIAARLLAAAPGTIAGPEFPPSSSACRDARDRSPLRRSSPVRSTPSPIRALARRAGIRRDAFPRVARRAPRGRRARASGRGCRRRVPSPRGRRDRPCGRASARRRGDAARSRAGRRRRVCVAARRRSSRAPPGRCRRGRARRRRRRDAYAHDARPRRRQAERQPAVEEGTPGRRGPLEVDLLPAGDLGEADGVG